MWPKLMECTSKVSRTWWHLWKFEHAMSDVRSHMKVWMGNSVARLKYSGNIAVSISVEERWKQWDWWLSMGHCKIMSKCPHYAYTYTENQTIKVEQPFEDWSDPRILNALSSARDQLLALVTHVLEVPETLFCTWNLTLIGTMKYVSLFMKLGFFN